MVRGESMIASTAFACAAVVVGVTIASAWWVTGVAERRATEDRRDEVARLTGMLANSAESLLAADETSALRRLVIETAQSGVVRASRVVLPNGRVVADSDPSRIDPSSLPEQWGGTFEDRTESVGAMIRVPMRVPGRGDALCEVEIETALSSGVGGAIQMGSLASGVCGLAMMLLVYRRFRSRLGAIGAVRESLAALSAGERDIESLLVHASFGPEAVAWNALLMERDERARQELSRQAADGAAVAVSAPGGAAVCDLLSDGVVLLDDHRCVAYANGAASVLLGVAREELHGASAPSPLDTGPVAEAIAEAARSGSRRREVIDVPMDDAGETVLRVGVRAARDLPGASVFVSVQDVTQMKLAEDSRSAFVAQATHELRAPLTNIRLYIEQLVDEGEQDATLRARAINVISNETNRLDRIVSDMLSVSELEAGAIALREDDVRLDQMFDSLQLDYAAQANERDIALRFELPPKLPVIHADRDKLCLAIHNLISNALKYTPSGGTVTVRVGVSTDDAVSIEVADTGIGIAPEQVGKVFERFGRADDERVRDVTGSGIGLSLAREVARLHGGDITVDSVLNEGSTFVLTIPARERPARAA